MALVLAIEPDLRQAEILKRIVHEKVKADVVIVDSRDAAMEAMRSKIPDVMLLSALLSPRDEDELVAHLRTLDNAEHLQTHTIPQLASDGGKGKAGGGGGLLKAFRRKKNREPEVAGCDPEHFADEIRVFLEQAEQKRFERAEDLKYRPAIKPIAAAAPSKAAAEAGQTTAAAAATTSWDSPFEWRKSDAIPLPSPVFEEEPPQATLAPIPEPQADVDLRFDSHQFGPSSFDERTEAQPAATSAGPAFEGAAPFALQALPPFEPDAQPAIEAHTVSSFEAAEPPLELPPQAPDADVAPAVEAQAAAPLEPEPIAAVEADPTSISEPAVEIAIAPVSPHVDQPERLDAPELFETFVAPPDPPSFEAPTHEAAAIESEPVRIEPITVSAEPIAEVITFSTPEAAAESITFDLAPIEEIAQAAETPAASIATPEEIESYGRTNPPVPEIEWIAETHAGGVDAEPLWQVSPTRAAAEISADPDADQEDIDLNWAAAEVADRRSASESVDIDVDALAVSVETADGDADVEAAAPKKLPPSLGPLATWARLERRNGDERRPGSDMREIIERLAVPPHIAGVSYARGVRIRRVRVAGNRDRHRPLDHKGPVILSRRALAATRSAAPDATA